MALNGALNYSLLRSVKLAKHIIIVYGIRFMNLKRLLCEIAESGRFENTCKIINKYTESNN